MLPEPGTHGDNCLAESQKGSLWTVQRDHESADTLILDLLVGSL